MVDFKSDYEKIYGDRDRAEAEVERLQTLLDQAHAFMRKHQVQRDQWKQVAKEASEEAEILRQALEVAEIALIGRGVIKMVTDAKTFTLENSAHERIKRLEADNAAMHRQIEAEAEISWSRKIINDELIATLKNIEERLHGKTQVDRSELRTIRVLVLTTLGKAGVTAFA